MDLPRNGVFVCILMREIETGRGLCALFPTIIGLVCWAPVFSRSLTLNCKANINYIFPTNLNLVVLVGNNRLTPPALLSPLCSFEEFLSGSSAAAIVVLSLLLLVSVCVRFFIVVGALICYTFSTPPPFPISCALHFTGLNKSPFKPTYNWRPRDIVKKKEEML